jgi:hypothetical protein
LCRAASPTTIPIGAYRGHPAVVRARGAAWCHQRTLAPIGERRILIAPDLVGTSAEIVESLRADPVLAEVTELQLELPYAFADEEYEQVLSDAVTSIAPQLAASTFRMD